METKKEIFKIENVTKVFSEKKFYIKALDNVSFDIYEGEILGIIGMSGAGKSTLVRTLNKLESVTNGSVFYDGKDLSLLSPKELRYARRSIGMIFQNFNLLTQKRVIDNVILPLKIAGGFSKAQMRERAVEMLKIVGISDKERVYPSKLSGGQKQRVAIARALCANPKVLLCDEATSALDPKTTDEILELLKSVNKNTKITIVIITHEMSIIEKICDRVVIMKDGKLDCIKKVSDVYQDIETYFSI